MSIEQNIKKLTEALLRLKFNRHTVDNYEKKVIKRQSLTVAEEAVAALQDVTKDLTKEQDRIFLKACDKLGTYYQYGLEDDAKALTYYKLYLAVPTYPTQETLHVKIKHFLALGCTETNKKEVIEKANEWSKKLAEEYAPVFKLLDNGDDITNEQVLNLLNYCYLQRIKAYFLLLIKVKSDHWEAKNTLQIVIKILKQLPLNRIATRTELANTLTLLSCCYQLKYDNKFVIDLRIEAYNHWARHDMMTGRIHTRSIINSNELAKMLNTANRFPECITILKNIVAQEAKLKIEIPAAETAAAIESLASAYFSSKDPLLALHHLKKLLARQDLAEYAPTALNQITQMVTVTLKNYKVKTKFRVREFEINYPDILSNLKFLQLCLPYCDQVQKAEYKLILARLQAFHSYQTNLIQERISGLEEDAKVNPEEKVEEKIAEQVTEKAEVTTAPSSKLFPALKETSKKRNSLHFFANDDTELLYEVNLDQDLTFEGIQNEQIRNEMRAKRVRR